MGYTKHELLMISKMHNIQNELVKLRMLIDEKSLEDENGNKK